MPEHMETVFDQMPELMKSLKKPKYEANMDRFWTNHRPMFDDMVACVGDTEDQEKVAQRVAERFVDSVIEKYSVRGKLRGRIEADLTFFMIYYVFPAILMTGHFSARDTADTIRDEWSSRIAKRQINYTDYESLQKTFREKIWGIF